MWKRLSSNRTRFDRPTQVAFVLASIACAALVATIVVVGTKKWHAHSIVPVAHAHTETSVATTEPATPAVAFAPPLVPPLVRRTYTAEAPLRLWVGGDSFAGSLGPAMIRALKKTGVVKQTTDARKSTGLSRPDVLNWPKHLASYLDQIDPEIVVLMVGGNDAQDITTADKKTLSTGTPEWREEYAARVRAMLDTVLKPNRQLIWVGIPVMENKHIQKYVPIANDIVRTEVQKREHATFIDTSRTLAGPKGEFVIRQPQPNGRTIQVREDDGVHPSTTGADMIAELVLETFAEECHLR